MKLENINDTDTDNTIFIDNQILKYSIIKLAEAMKIQILFLKENMFHVSQ